MEYVIGALAGWIVGSIGTALMLCLFMGRQES